MAQIEFRGEIRSLTGWARIIGITPATLHARLKKGWPLAEALTTPRLAHNECRPGRREAGTKKRLDGREMATAVCAACASLFAHPSNGTAKTTCSPACKTWWRSRNRRDDNRQAKSLGQTPCGFCARPFDVADYRGRARYCSKECRGSACRFRVIEATYGIDRAGWTALFESQGRRCAICRTAESGRWATDHDHVTGIVRGILCSQCNTGLGLFRENEEVFAAAVEYLRRGKQRVRLV